MALGIAEDPARTASQGDVGLGWNGWTSFLSSRGEAYRFSMSSPVTAASRCSRISPYLAFGCLSMREVWQACRAGVGVLADRPPETRRAWRQSLKSFDSRLHWHCHFIQKLEDEPAAEFRSFHSAYHGLDKNHEEAAAFLAAWQEGRTGYPLVDAYRSPSQPVGWPSHAPW